MYVKVDVSKPANNKGAGGNKKDIIIPFDFSDVLTFPSRDSKGIVINNNIVMKPGKYMVQLYATLPSIKPSANSEGDPDASAIIQQVEFEHPGDEAEIREFRSNWLNVDCGIIIQRADGTVKNLYGAPDSPLRMEFKHADDDKSNKNTFTFKSIVKGKDVAIYNGTLTLASVMGTQVAAAATIDVAAGEGQYQLTSGSSAVVPITGLTNAVDGLVYTLLGSGGSYPPTIATAGNFILANGTQYTALAGSQITFKAFKDGASSFKFIELSRA